MSYVGGGWRSGSAGDITGSASTAAVTLLAPSTAPARGGAIVLTVTGTGFVAGTLVYAEFNPVATNFVNATTLTCPTFNPMPDSGGPGTINVGARKPGEALSSTRPFTAT